MAVAVKNTPEVSTPGLLDRMAVASLAGTLYVIGALGIVFVLVPYLWDLVLRGGLSGPFANAALLGIVMVAVACALGFVGVRLLGPHAAPGVRAGIFVGLLWVLINLLLTRWFSMWMEHWVYDNGWFGSAGPTVGASLTALVLFLLLALQVRTFLKRGWEKFLVRFEGQGWFTATAFKPLQGLKVRRGTIFGLLVIVLAGIYTMVTHGTFKGQDWTLNVPFTGRVVVENPGDATRINPAIEPGTVLSRPEWQQLNAEMGNYVKVTITHGEGNFKSRDIVPRETFDREIVRLKKAHVNSDLLPQSVGVTAPTGSLDYRTLTLLPSLRFTVPLLLLAGALWVSWRIVNMPTFADFLIATEAELNKVSWTTRRRLVQDTIVVLVTVVLLAFYLFAMDQVWRVVLSWKPIGVLRLQQDESEANTSVEQKRW